ncbi:MAG: hypothetical protein RJA44_773 [Pseudomonadota bacterium]|jgi:flagellar basal-body rod modification protein FlgD
MSSTVSGTSSTSSLYQQLSGSASTQSTTDAAADRFLKLLVAQMQNQDPLNPMDNAQMTTQMAQINTVSGIEKVNESVQSLGSQFVQMQALQGAALVGRNALVEGNSVKLGSDGSGTVNFELAGPADAVKVEVLSPAGRVLDTINLGAETSGRQALKWTPPAGVDASGALTFRVSAVSGSNQVGVTTLSNETVRAVTTSGSTLNLELQNGSTVAYGKVRAIS